MLSRLQSSLTVFLPTLQKVQASSRLRPGWRAAPISAVQTAGRQLVCRVAKTSIFTDMLASPLSTSTSQVQRKGWKSRMFWLGRFPFCVPCVLAATAALTASVNLLDSSAVHGPVFQASSSVEAWFAGMLDNCARRASIALKLRHADAVEIRQGLHAVQEVHRRIHISQESIHCWWQPFFCPRAKALQGDEAIDHCAFAIGSLLDTCRQRSI